MKVTCKHLEFSLRSVLRATLAGRLMLKIIKPCFQEEKYMNSNGYRILAMLIKLVTLRYVLPFEFYFMSKPLCLPFHPAQKMQSLILAFHSYIPVNPAHQQVHLWRLLLHIWGIGFLIQLRSLLLYNLQTRRLVFRFGAEVSQKFPYYNYLQSLSSQDPRINKCNLSVFLAPGFATPCQVGIFSAYIVLPYRYPAAEKELHYILHHEALHCSHRDALLKECICLLKAFYWWDPDVCTLFDHVDLLLEMRIDRELVKDNPLTRDEYLYTLMCIKQYTYSQVTSNQPTCFVVSDSHTDLELRFLMICHNYDKLPLKCYLPGLLSLLVFLVSFCI